MYLSTSRICVKGSLLVPTSARINESGTTRQELIIYEFSFGLKGQIPKMKCYLKPGRTTSSEASRYKSAILLVPFSEIVVNEPKFSFELGIGPELIGLSLLVLS